jgi:hypothetical protein
MTCPLCGVTEREPENIIWNGTNWVIIRTKKLKGHRERLMILWKNHVDMPPIEVPEYIYEKLKKPFDYAKKIVVMEGKYGSIPEHWHLCVTDLDPKSEDFEQILGTPWIKVVEVHAWK